MRRGVTMFNLYVLVRCSQGPKLKKLRSKLRVQLDKWRKQITPTVTYKGAAKVKREKAAVIVVPPPPATAALSAAVTSTTPAPAAAIVSPVTNSNPFVTAASSEQRRCPLFVNIFNPQTGLISWQETSRIRTEMMSACVDTAPDDFCPRFRHSRRVDGQLLHVLCTDAASKHWLAHLVWSLGFAWNDAPLPASLQPPPLPPGTYEMRMYTWSADFFVQGQPVTIPFLLRLLRRQNGDALRIDRWEVVRFETYRRDDMCGQCGHFVVFGMPAASQRALMVQQECFLYYGLCKVPLERFRLPEDF